MVKRTLAVVAMMGVLGCEGANDAGSERENFSTGKADIADDLNIRGMLNPGQAEDGALGSGDRHGYIMYAGAGAQARLEVTQAGSSRRLDSVLRIYGPRSADGTYGEMVASDDESGWGQLSRIDDFSPSEAGHYLVELTHADDANENELGNYRLLLECDACEEGDTPEPQPVADLPDNIHWTRNSAEYRASTVQAYRTATYALERRLAAGELPERWAVVLDADDTVLSNSQYEKERAELGLGYSSPSWAAWVARREATAVPGAVAFIARVHELGGVVAIVTNRRDEHCADTSLNIDALGAEHDIILCKTGTSDKAPRWAMVEEGRAAADVAAAPIVMFVGDNIHDFPGMEQEVRFEDESALADFAERFIVIPNPMYGSWTSNDRL